MAGCPGLQASGGKALGTESLDDGADKEIGWRKTAFIIPGSGSCFPAWRNRTCSISFFLFLRRSLTMSVIGWFVGLLKGLLGMLLYQIQYSMNPEK